MPPDPRMDRETDFRVRRWANVIVLVASAYALAGSWLSSPEVMVDTGEVAVDGWLWGVYVGAGLAGFTAVFSAVRWPFLGKVLTALAGLTVLMGFFALRRVTLFAALSLGLTAAAFFLATGFMGAMPTPEEEGKRR